MTLWDKIVLGVKFVFGGFEAATDYLFKLLNDYMGTEDIIGHVQKAREYLAVVIKYMDKYRKFCPVKWTADYEVLIQALQTANNALADNKITQDEFKKVVEDIKTAVQEWMKD